MAKKKSKRKLVVIIIICVVAALLIAAGGSLLKMNSEQKKMKPIDTGEFLPGIYAVKTGYVNMFLIKADAGYIAVDTGASENDVKQSLAQLGVSSDEVAAVLMTHTHGDHTAALKLFDKASIYGANQGVANKTVSDGDVLEVLGKEFRVIAATGHADDSVCYLYDGKYLFAGDNISLDGNKVGMFNSVFNKSDEQQKADIEKLAGLQGVEYIITAHYGFTDNYVFP
jgi:glyoxylase-like metal-dependent hydrolase (beta-lactamase superfamily II)